MNTETLSQIPLFAGFPLEDLAPLAAATTVDSFDTHDCVFLEGSPMPSGFPVLVTGSLQLVKTSFTGRETILRLLGPGAFFGWAALLDGHSAPATARLLAPSEVAFLPRQELLSLMAERPELSLRVMADLSERLRELHERLHDSISERARTRVARLLLRFESPTGNRLSVLLPHEILSRMVGITYDESVRILGEWSHPPRALLRYQRGGRITLLDPERLRAIARGHEPEPQP